MEILSIAIYCGTIINTAYGVQLTIVSSFAI